MSKTWYEKIIEAHLAVTDQVSHAEHMKSDRYFVWQEDGANDFQADGIHAEKAVTGTTDLYTKMEFDPWKDQLSAAFDNAGIPWYINSIQYEEDTGYFHYEWVWSVWA